MSLDSSMKILVADDMPTMRIIVEKMLKSLGYSDIHTFEDGQQAFDAFQKMNEADTPFDFIISDWNMPVLNGLNFLKKIRAHDAGQKIPFLMVTTVSDKAKIVEALNHGVSHYVMKPLTVEDLEGKINKIIERENAA